MYQPTLTRSGETKCAEHKSKQSLCITRTIYVSNYLGRSHRERKEAYLKSLELEVNRLRKSEESWRSETHKLRAEVKELKDALARNGIPVPLDEQCTPSDGIADVTFEFEITDGAANKGKQPTILARRVPPLDNSSGLPVGASQGMQLYTQPETIYQNADPTGVGISFVLR